MKRAFLILQTLNKNIHIIKYYNLQKGSLLEKFQLISVII